jgi:hypothetical protein
MEKEKEPTLVLLMQPIQRLRVKELKLEKAMVKEKELMLEEPLVLLMPLIQLLKGLEKEKAKELLIIKAKLKNKTIIHKMDKIIQILQLKQGTISLI